MASYLTTGAVGRMLLSPPVVHSDRFVQLDNFLAPIQEELESLLQSHKTTPYTDAAYARKRELCRLLSYGDCLLEYLCKVDNPKYYLHWGIDNFCV